MTLDEWAKQEKEHIDRFVAWWKENGEDKTPFPDAMQAGHWDEQYRSWDY